VKYVAVATVVIALFVAYCSSARSDDELSEDLCGRWVTGDKRFRDRCLVLTHEEVCFGTGGAELQAFPILEVEKKEGGAQVGYVITYRDPAGQESRLHIEHMISRGTLRLTNQPRTVWKKAVPRDPDEDI